MTTYTKVLLSSSVDGSPTKVVATATPGTTIHTAAASGIDELFVYLTNTSAADVVATLEYGDVTAPDHNVKVIVPANDTILAIGGSVIQNSKILRAFAAVANVINAFGYVNRIT